MKLFTAALLAVLSVAARQAGATILYDQTVGATGGLIPSSWWTPDGYDADTYAYDNFSLKTNSSVTDVYWRGGNIFGIPAAVQSFTIRFYRSIAGGSQPLIVSLPPDETPASYLQGFDVDITQAPSIPVKGTSLSEYHFHLPTPLLLKGRTTYWIKIEAAIAGYPSWGLAAGTHGDGSHITYYTGGPYFLRGPGDTAFRLTGKVLPTT